MPSRAFAQILQVIGDRLAPPEKRSLGKGAVKDAGTHSKTELRLRLVLERKKDAVDLGE